MTDASNDEFIAWLEDEFGLEGYARWWKLLEVVASQMNSTDRCSAEYPWKLWQTFLRGKRKKLETFLKTLENNGKLTLKDSGNVLEISIPKLASLRDNHTRHLQASGGKSVASKEVDVEGEGEVTSMEQSSAEQIRLRYSDIHDGYTFDVQNPKSEGLVEGENWFLLSDLPSLPKLTLTRLLYAVFAQREWWGKLCASAEAVGVSPYQFLGTWRKRFEKDAERHMGDAQRGIAIAFAAAAEAPQLDSLNVPEFESKAAFWKYFQSFLLGESGDEAALYVQARRWVYSESQDDDEEDMDIAELGATVLEGQA